MERRTWYTVDGREAVSETGMVERTDVLATAGLPDVAGNLVIQGDGGRARLVQPDAAVVLDEDGRSAFRTFRDGRLYYLKVDGRVWEWGAPSIGEDDVRAIAGVPDEEDLTVVGADEPLRRGSVIDLTAGQVPQIRSRPALGGRARVPIVINGRRMEIAGPEIAFDELVRVAFPAVSHLDRPNRALTVTYRHGPPDRPEGSLTACQSLRLQPGMVLGVTATTKG